LRTSASRPRWISSRKSSAGAPKTRSRSRLPPYARSACYAREHRGGPQRGHPQRLNLDRLKEESGHFYFGENRTSVLWADSTEAWRPPPRTGRALAPKDGQRRRLHSVRRPRWYLKGAAPPSGSMSVGCRRPAESGQSAPAIGLVHPPRLRVRRRRRAQSNASPADCASHPVGSGRARIAIDSTCTTVPTSRSS